jgi:hypothetical protein
LNQRRKITAVFGKNILWPLSVSKDATIRFFGLEEHGLHLYDPIIIVAGTISHALGQQKQRDQVITREREITNALKNGAHVCILCHDPGDPLFQQILSNNNLRFIRSIGHITETTVKRSEFTLFLNGYGTAFGIFSDENSLVHIISTTTKVYISALYPESIKTHKGEYILGFSFKKYSGMMTFLPFFISSGQSTYDENVYRIVTVLRNALEIHKKNIFFEQPVWIDEIRLHEEDKLKSQISELENPLKQKKTELSRQQYLKSILWLKHNQLRDVCMDVFREMGMKTKEDDKGDEDFWILSDEGLPLVICEVKGKDNDVVRGDLIKFEASRDAAGKDENFPSLLIANTHNKSESLLEKDQSIVSNVIEKGVRNNIVLVRTLDLIRMLDLYQKSKITKVELQEIITKPTGGWLHVKDEIKLMQK